MNIAGCACTWRCYCILARSSIDLLEVRGTILSPSELVISLACLARSSMQLHRFVRFCMRQSDYAVQTGKEKKKESKGNRSMKKLKAKKRGREKENDAEYEEPKEYSESRGDKQ